MNKKIKLKVLNIIDKQTKLLHILVQRVGDIIGLLLLLIVIIFAARVFG